MTLEYKLPAAGGTVESGQIDDVVNPYTGDVIGLDDRLLGRGGFSIERKQDRTENMARMAARWAAARGEHQDQLRAAESNDNHEGQQGLIALIQPLSSVPRSILIAVAFAACSAGDGTPPVHEGFLAGADSAQLFYRVVAAGPDTLVAVHGGPGAGMNAFLPDLQPLADHHTVIFYDQRGGGRSELPADTSRLSARYHVEDLEAVRRHFGLERMNILAHSFGAILVAKYAESYPERIGRLILIGAVGPQRAAAAAVARSPYAEADSATLRRLLRVMEVLFSGTAADPVAACREYESVSRELALARDDTTRWLGSTCNMPAEAVRYYYRYTARMGPASFGDWDFTSSLDEVTAPVLIIHGDRDAAGLEAQRAWAAAWPNAHLLRVPDAGKGALADRPEFVFDAIDQFLNGQ